MRFFVQSGYFGYQNDSVYYAKVILAHHTVYSIRFYYPTANRRFCDAVVGDVDRILPRCGTAH